MLNQSEEIDRRERIALDDLLGLSKGHSVAFLKSYFDESISHHKAQPNLLFVGGCTMETNDWLKLETRWNPILKDFGVTAFRSSDCNASKGEFVGWDGYRKDEFRACLIDAINQSWGADICPVIQWCGLDQNVFKDVASEFPNVVVSPYEFCVWAIVIGSKSAIANIRGVNTLGIFFEEGQDIRPHIRRKLHEISQAECRIVDISFVCKQDNMPFQVADMIAYEAWKSYTEGERKTLLNLKRISALGTIFCSEDNIRDGIKNNFACHS
jgi:hypothetical protein